MTLCFGITCCGMSGLWLFWSIRVQTLHEVRSKLRRGRRDLPWWTDLICQRVGKCSGRESWLHTKEPVYSTCRFLGSCFLSDNNNKSNFSAFSSCLFLVLQRCSEVRVQLALLFKRVVFLLGCLSFLFCSSHWHVRNFVYHRDLSWTCRHF